MAQAPPPRFVRNLIAVLLWELVWGFGAACTSSAIFVPFLSQLAGSKKLVGAVGLTTLLSIPALFVSLWIGHRLVRRRAVVIVLYVLQVVGWAVLGAVIVSSSASVSAPAIVPVIYISQAFVAFLGGVSMAPTYQMLTRGFGERFGTAQGLQMLVRQVSGVAGGLWAASALAQDRFPRNYGFTFLAGGALLTVSNLALLFFAEEEGVVKNEESTPFVTALVGLLGSARAIAPLFVVTALAAYVTTAESMFVVSALERLHLGDAYAGVFASVTIGAQGIGGAVAGASGDQKGHTRVLVVTLLVQLVAFALVISLLHIAQFYFALVLAGLSNAAMQIGLAGLTARLAPDTARGAFIAMMRWVVQITSAVALIFVAFVTDHAGYTILFASCVFPPAIAIVLVRRFASRELAHVRLKP